MKDDTGRFKAAATEALGNAELRANLKNFGQRFKMIRRNAFGPLKDPEALRLRARAVKDRAMAALPELLERLEKNVVAAGGRVHWAADAEEARAVVLELARSNGVREVVKGKSMTAEEIGLNEALEEAGIWAAETDLGEYIVQLAGEKPSHIIAPAVHKNRFEIGDLFAEKLGVEPTYDPGELNAIARATLRERFLSAEMGLTGVNMAVAETGSIVLLENEGNIRFSTTAPRIHVALMGLDKVVADLEDMADLLNILPRSAAGQKMCSYVSIITGPRRAGEPDGPDEFHLIILDNGRSRIAADPVLRESLYCLRCGSCLNVCPVYLRIGGFSYGWVYTGPIGSVLNPQFLPPGRGKDLPFASTLCGACAEVCPVMIDLPKLMLHLRWKLAEDPTWQGRPPVTERLAAGLWAWLNRHPAAEWAAACLARPLAPALTPPALKRWSRVRVPPRLARRPFSRRWPALKARLAKNGGGR